MERINESLNREREKYGRNVIINAWFVRHGEKGLSTNTAETTLTEGGKKKSSEFGKKFLKQDMIKSYSSDTDRTKETARLIVDNSPTTEKGVQRIQDELAFHYDPKGNFTKEVMRIKKETLGDDFEKLDAKDKQERIAQSDCLQNEYYLNFSDRRPDPKTYSPVETAALLAKRLSVYMNMTEKLCSGSKIDLVNTSHDFSLTAFLHEVILREVDGKKVRGFNNIVEIGGPIEFNEAFNVCITTNEQGIKSYKLFFRGTEYVLDDDRLEELGRMADDIKD
ncbi:MAG: histidine phosphatase family protein [Patescibacteria group bacterium]